MSGKDNQQKRSLQGEKTSKAPEKTFDIFTVLGHDLKSPLNAVEAYLEIMRGKIMGESLDPYMTILDNSIARLHHMRELITDVVDWSRITRTTPDRELAAIDLSKIVNLVLDGYIQKARDQNIFISSDIEEGTTLKASAGDIELMLRHILDNALRYNRDGGSVQLRMRCAGPEVILTVADTGIGMNEEELSRLFVEFVRIKNAKTQDIRGTGLGLAIVNKIVGLYQGTVSVKSEPDTGTTFSVTLPSG